MEKYVNNKWGKSKEIAINVDMTGIPSCFNLVGVALHKYSPDLIINIGTGLGNYVIGMCVPVACGFFSQEKKKRKIEISYCGRYTLEGKA